MRVTGHERASHQINKIPCGTSVLRIAKIPYHMPFLCGRWDCENCKQRKTARCLRDFKASFTALFAYVSHYPAPITKQERIRLNNFLNRETPGAYQTFQSDSEMIIISKSSHPGAQRMKTEAIINNLISSILQDSWSGKPYANRSTHSQSIERINNDKSINDNPVYATWTGSIKAEREAESEFKALTTDPERAQWLSYNDLEGNIKLSKRGQELIDQCDSQSEPRQEVSEEEILLYANEGK